MFISWWILVIGVVAFFWLCWRLDITNDRITNLEDRLYEAGIPEKGGIPEMGTNIPRMAYDLEKAKNDILATQDRRTDERNLDDSEIPYEIRGLHRDLDDLSMRMKRIEEEIRRIRSEFRRQA